MISMGINAQELREMLAFVADRITKEEARLNELDAALGDGDHGITMRIGFEAVVRRITELDLDTGMDKLFMESGMAFMSATGGAIGVVLGKMLMAAGRVLRSQISLGPAEFKDALMAMELSVSASGKVKRGDKTILDAISGACLSLSGSESSLPEALGKAAQAAKASAQGTAGMICRVGRASRLGDRVLGHPDPGAVSFAIILQAMSDWAGAREGPIASP